MNLTLTHTSCVTIYFCVHFMIFFFRYRERSIFKEALDSSKHLKLHKSQSVWFKCLSLLYHCTLYGGTEACFLCVRVCLTFQRVWTLEGEQLGSGKRRQWHCFAPRPRVHADHQAAGPPSHTQCHHREHHQKIWNTLPSLSYIGRYRKRTQIASLYNE